MKVVFLTPYVCLYHSLLLGFHQNSIVKIIKSDFVLNSSIVPKVLSYFQIDPKLVEAFERLESLGTLPELATENIF